jgi:hypothetical protein
MYRKSSRSACPTSFPTSPRGRSLAALPAGLRHGVAVLLGTLACALSVHAGEPAPAPDASPPHFNLISGIDSGLLRTALDPEEESGRAADGTLVLRGPVDQQMIRRLNEALAGNNITTVRITSHRGNAVDALVIGTTILLRGIDVVVHDLCLGPCAQYIFVAGRQRRLEPGALVGFVSSVESMANMLEIGAATLDVPLPLTEQFQAARQVEKELLRRRGVRESMLQDVQAAIQPACVIFERNPTHVGWNATTNYILWVPTREYLKSVGVEFEGDWPASRRQMRRLAGRFVSDAGLQEMRFGDDDHLRRFWQKKYSVEDLRKCIVDELPRKPAQ